MLRNFNCPANSAVRTRAEEMASSTAWLLLGLVAMATGFRASLQPRGCAPQGLGCAPRQPRQPPVVASYQELKSIDSKVDELQSHVNDMLLGFYDRRRSCFALTPGRPRYSITSTCCSLLAVDASRIRWRDQARLRIPSPHTFSTHLLRTPSPHTFSAHPLRTPSARPPHALRALCSVHPQPCTPLLAQLNVQKVVDALLLEEWRGDDLYQKTLTISTLLLLDPQCAALRRHPEQCPKFAEAVGSILDARPSRQRRNEPASAYMRYWAARALMLLSDEQRLVSAAIPAEALPDGELQQAPAKGVGVGPQQAPAKGVGVGPQQATARAPLVCSNALSPSPVPGMMDVSSQLPHSCQPHGCHPPPVCPLHGAASPSSLQAGALDGAQREVLGRAPAYPKHVHRWARPQPETYTRMCVCIGRCCRA